MTVLAIETSTRQLGVAAIHQGQVLASYELLADYPHAVELPGAVARVLEAARATLDGLEAIVVDVGPGSFTGLRIGLAFIKALSFSRKLPLVGVPSLDVLAANLPWSPKPVCVILDARQKNVYGALYRLAGIRPVKHAGYFLGPADDLLAMVKEPAIFLGDGASLYRDQIVKRCPQAEFAAQELWLPRAATLARLGLERFVQGQRDDAKTLVPLYLYPLDCAVRGPDRPTAVLPKQPVQAA